MKNHAMDTCIQIYYSEKIPLGFFQIYIDLLNSLIFTKNSEVKKIIKAFFYNTKGLVSEG